jgi:hypothetical protein
VNMTRFFVLLHRKHVFLLHWSAVMWASNVNHLSASGGFVGRSPDNIRLERCEVTREKSTVSGNAMVVPGVQQLAAEMQTLPIQKEAYLRSSRNGFRSEFGVLRMYFRMYCNTGKGSEKSARMTDKALEQCHNVHLFFSQFTLLVLQPFA